MDLNIEHHPERACFTAAIEGGRGRLDYRLAPGVMTIVHTEVDPQIGGHGVAGALVQAALDHARQAGLKVEPACAYARTYMERHPETASLRA